MSSYVITGASKGLGFGFLKQLSSDPSNTVIGFVRDLPTTKEKVARELPDRKNIHLFRGDLNEYESLKMAFAETAKITNGSLDVLIANAASQTTLLALDPIKHVINDPVTLEKDILQNFQTNAVGNIHLFNLGLRLLHNGTVKKVIVLSSAMGDPDFVAEMEVDVAAPYAISKAALNMVVAKFHAEYKKDGILFMGISPGFVATSVFDWVSEEDKHKLGAMGAKFAAYAPDFKGPITVEESVTMVLGVAEEATIEKNGGIMVSHLGNKRWL